MFNLFSRRKFIFCLLSLITISCNCRVFYYENCGKIIFTILTHTKKSADFFLSHIIIKTNHTITIASIIWNVWGNNKNTNDDNNNNNNECSKNVLYDWVFSVVHQSHLNHIHFDSLNRFHFVSPSLLLSLDVRVFVHFPTKRWYNIYIKKMCREQIESGKINEKKMNNLRIVYVHKYSTSTQMCKHVDDNRRQTAFCSDKNIKWFSIMWKSNAYGMNISIFCMALPWQLQTSAMRYCNEMRQMRIIHTRTCICIYSHR